MVRGKCAANGRDVSENVAVQPLTRPGPGHSRETGREFATGRCSPWPTAPIMPSWRWDRPRAAPEGSLAQVRGGVGAVHVLMLLLETIGRAASRPRAHWVPGRPVVGVWAPWSAVGSATRSWGSAYTWVEAGGGTATERPSHPPSWRTARRSDANTRSEEMT